MKNFKHHLTVICKYSVLSSFFILLFANTYANNLQISNATRTGAGLDEIEFTLSWENSWNVAGAPNNHDAVWVFIKFRECGLTSNEWSHALLSTTMIDHSFDTDITYATAVSETDRFGNGTGHNTGVLIKRSSIGIGDISDQTVRLKIVGSSNAVLLDPSTEYDIKVFGIEMVYIPEGQFYAGDGTSYYSIFEPGTSPGQPILIDSEDPFSIAHYSASYSHTIPLEYPKGYGSFYVMKYEITHGQYVAFLNTINSSMQTNRAYIYNYYSHDIQYDGNQYYTNSEDRVKNYLSFDDFLSYLDWAALRPMSELEYEKACRGPLDFVGGEHAWGTGLVNEVKDVTEVTGAVSGVEYAVVPADANCNINKTSQLITGGQFTTGGGTNTDRGPVAAGMFARTAPFDRIGTGSTYYGVMEMSGNVQEFCIQTNTNYTSNNPSPYTGIWGDGQLTSTGFYDATNWPTSGYFVRKGGAWVDVADRARVSDRYSSRQTTYTSRSHEYGGRGVR
ncbi:MAG: SUMF1/EgtB/PvdO family nonheme iron enzyme [Bacteroidales bacterium]|nr:SUMF1/EgtB/PvdO family nonheme iron enzyme [Bacteroidales bacterium]